MMSPLNFSLSLSAWLHQNDKRANSSSLSSPLTNEHINEAGNLTSYNAVLPSTDESSPSHKRIKRQRTQLQSHSAGRSESSLSSSSTIIKEELNSEAENSENSADSAEEEEADVTGDDDEEAEEDKRNYRRRLDGKFKENADEDGDDDQNNNHRHGNGRRGSLWRPY